MAPALDVAAVYGVPDGSLDDVVRLLRSTGWGADRDGDGVRRMLDHTDIVVGVPYRGRGLGSRVVEELCSHPALADVERLSLECRPDLVDFYRPFDFEPAPSGATLMIRERRE